jgi:predicted cupin superfamily sugar epimerase
MTTCNNGKDARYWIRKLGLLKHPEGGFYRERYRSDITLETHIDFVNQQHDKPVQFGARSIASSIYYLLEGNQVSFFHKLSNADEIWHFYTGSSLTIYSINETKRKIYELKLGDGLDNREMVQILIKRGTWFGAKVNNISSYSLVGCTVFPAFTFEDFQLADRDSLVIMYPAYRGIIEMLTKSPD